MRSSKAGIGTALCAALAGLSCAAPPDGQGALGVSSRALAQSACGLPGGYALELAPVGSYRSGIFGQAAAEIVAHDPSTQRAFVVNAAQARIDVLDVADPSAPSQLAALAFADLGAFVNSVAIHGGLAAVAIEGHVKTDAGSVAFVDTTSLATLAVVEVGAQPDMLAFTPDGRYVLTANEGEPSSDYAIDPEGSVSIIDVAGGAVGLDQARVRTAGFAAFNGASLDPSIRVYGPGASVAQDLEPEYLSVTPDGKTAFVTLQENNALARVDVASATVLELLPLGFKAHDEPGQGLDASDRDGAIEIAAWPVQGMYLPDAIASYRYRGQDYLVLANEGDVREWDAFDEEARVRDLTLDRAAFPDATLLQNSSQLGRLKVTRALGDSDGDGDYDALYGFGARSFSIRAADGTLIYDSGDDFEQIVAGDSRDYFNSNHESSAFDDRSDDKGPEPEGVTLGKLMGRTLAFIALERVGGIVTYDVTNPYAPCFLGYTNHRNFAADADSDAALDLGPEGLAYITAESSPSGEPLLMVANEVSGSTTIFAVRKTR